MQARDVTLGIDLGTSAVKALLLDETGAVVAEAGAPLEVSRPHPLWSEQDPDAWWSATREAVRALPGGLAGLRAIGLSGQMHGATLLDASDRPLRPAILWNDGRSHAECHELEQAVPESRRITGNLAMPGFTAPKLLWTRRHEPEVFGQTARVLLPKDYLRLRMTGEHATDLSDASGTLWVDVARRCWSDPMLEACGLTPDAMPALHEGPETRSQHVSKHDDEQSDDKQPVHVANRKGRGGDDIDDGQGGGQWNPNLPQPAQRGMPARPAQLLGEHDARHWEPITQDRECVSARLRRHADERGDGIGVEKQGEAETNREESE